MPRINRIVIPDIPHHVTQRGNRNQRVFFSDRDRHIYLSLIRTFSLVYNVDIWAYCLMDNHVHFIAVPKDKDGFVHCFQEVHKAYTRSINLREKWRGYLWQGRFSSFPMDEAYLVAAIRYVECNPVQAGMVQKAEDYPWSSARAHVSGSMDPVLSPCYLTESIGDWAQFLSEADAANQSAMEDAIRTGRPLGSQAFIEKLEHQIGRSVKKKKPGPLPKEKKLLSDQDTPDLLPR